MARVWHAGERIEPCGASVSESEAPHVLHVFLAPILLAVRGCRLVGLLAMSAADSASAAPGRLSGLRRFPIAGLG